MSLIYDNKSIIYNGFLVMVANFIIINLFCYLFFTPQQKTKSINNIDNGKYSIIFTLNSFL